MGEVDINSWNSLPSFLNMNLLELLPPTLSSIPQSVAHKHLVSHLQPRFRILEYDNPITSIKAPSSRPLCEGGPDT